MIMSERSRDRPIHRRYCPRLAAGEASRMTAPARVTPIKVRSAATVARAVSDVQQAWTAAPRTVRTLTLGAGIAALLSSVSVDVPLARTDCSIMHIFRKRWVLASRRGSPHAAQHQHQIPALQRHFRGT